MKTALHMGGDIDQDHTVSKPADSPLLPTIALTAGKYSYSRLENEWESPDQDTLYETSKPLHIHTADTADEQSV